jgi:poly-gamma-glutamate synthesis protein (capsule biosynthesis protein)
LLEAKASAILSANAPEFLEWTLLVSDDPAAELESGNAELCLCAEESGTKIGNELIAFTVPFVSYLEMITYQEALEIYENGDYTIEVELWSEMPVDRKALSIGGVSPQDDGYLFVEDLYISSTPGSEEAALYVADIFRDNFGADTIVSLAAVGDVMLDYGLGQQILLGYIDYPFGQVAGYLQEADITVGNFESAMTNIGEPLNKVYVFNAPLNAAESLTYAGFDLMTLANNHALDYGPEALSQTIGILNRYGIGTFGAGEDIEDAYAPVIMEVDGLKIAFLGYLNTAEEISGHDPYEGTASEDTPGAAWASPDNVVNGINAIKDEVDIVVVVLHSGLEYCETPSPTQVTLSQAAINAGADIVIGHHAHTLQGVQFYNGGVIVYGLGNFAFQDDIIFGDTCGTTTYSYRSAILNVYFDHDGVREIEFVPVVLDESGRPFPAYGDDAESILSRIYLLTQYLD